MISWWLLQCLAKKCLQKTKINSVKKSLHDAITNMVSELGNTIKFDDCIIKEYDALRILQIKIPLLEEGITSVCLPLNIKNLPIWTKLKIYICVPSSGARLPTWASKLIAPMQNISSISISTLDVTLKISESAVAIFLCLQSTLRVSRLPAESFMRYYSWPFRMMWDLSIFSLANGKIGRSKIIIKFQWEIGEEVSELRKKNFTFTYSFVCEMEKR